jgi:hypothetical protein
MVLCLRAAIFHPLSSKLGVFKMEVLIKTRRRSPSCHILKRLRFMSALPNKASSESVKEEVSISPFYNLISTNTFLFRDLHLVYFHL